ncbi:hypothetical protein GCM10010298_55630 [Streptomyces microflavus]|uniref:Uncharacterized protein n=1 Tax=Streptomyces microflavus TaxID=1919 RepID=A0A7J0CQG0_STRMI|nr:hypothetical protein Smic_32450 [Streptomyces microflavus]GGX83209.1 hypothetical protein GCM10010298_55630 [Streptomyces microflavus]
MAIRIESTSVVVVVGGYVVSGSAYGVGAGAGPRVVLPDVVRTNRQRKPYVGEIRDRGSHQPHPIEGALT